MERKEEAWRARGKGVEREGHGWRARGKGYKVQCWHFLYPEVVSTDICTLCFSPSLFSQPLNKVFFPLKRAIV